MRELLTVNGTATGAEIPCPAGKRVRLLALNLLVSAVTDFDTVAVTVARSGQVLFKLTTGALSNSASSVCFGLGHNTVDAPSSGFNVVTGASALSTGQDTAQASVPDVWLPYAVALSYVTAGSGATIDGSAVLYELEDV